jgi:UDP-N-acetyl-D-galactosamine dehydrogenase
LLKEQNLLSKKIDNGSANVAVIGTGYIGLPLILNIAKKYSNVIGYDINKKRIDTLKKNVDINREFSSKTLKRFKKKINFTNDSNILEKSDIFILCIPTPINKQKLPNITELKKACKLTSQYLNKGKLVIIESTVYPGCTEKILKPILSKKKINFFLGISPERINPGDKKHTLNNIVKVTSGNDIYSKILTKKFYEKILKKKFVKPVNQIKTAEMAKLLENSQRDINIAFMNEVFKICESLNINFDETFEAASTKWNFLKFTPGLVGGHCIGVDPYYLDHAASENGYKSKLILSGRDINNDMFKFIKKKIIMELKKIKPQTRKFKILICGATFKENVADIRNSQSLSLYLSLKKEGHIVHLFDPLVEKKSLSKSFRQNFKTKLKNNFYDNCFIGVKHKVFNKLGKSFFIKKCRSNHFIYDFKKVFKN